MSNGNCVVLMPCRVHMMTNNSIAHKSSSCSTLSRILGSKFIDFFWNYSQHFSKFKSSKPTSICFVLNSSQHAFVYIFCNYLSILTFQNIYLNDTSKCGQILCVFKTVGTGMDWHSLSQAYVRSHITMIGHNSLFLLVYYITPSCYTENSDYKTNWNPCWITVVFFLA